MKRFMMLFTILIGALITTACPHSHSNAVSTPPTFTCTPTRARKCPTTVVPEPGTYMLLGTGLIAIAMMYKMKLNGSLR